MLFECNRFGIHRDDGKKRERSEQTGLGDGPVAMR